MSVPFPLERASRRWPAQAKQAHILPGDKEITPGHGTIGRLNMLGKYNTERTPPYATNRVTQGTTWSSADQLRSGRSVFPCRV